MKQTAATINHYHQLLHIPPHNHHINHSPLPITIKHHSLPTPNVKPSPLPTASPPTTTNHIHHRYCILHHHLAPASKQTITSNHHHHYHEHHQNCDLPPPTTTNATMCSCCRHLPSSTTSQNTCNFLKFIGNLQATRPKYLVKCRCNGQVDLQHGPRSNLHSRKSTCDFVFDGNNIVCPMPMEPKKPPKLPLAKPNKPVEPMEME